MDFETILVLALIGWGIYSFSSGASTHLASADVDQLTPDEVAKLKAFGAVGAYVGMTHAELYKMYPRLAPATLGEQLAAEYTAAGVPGLSSGMLMSDARPILNANREKIAAYILATKGQLVSPIF